uniref:Uncharacterized protein n=1 Tax=Rhizophora mucronata TaxID=61149 RepID=A0A2P2L4Q2_RHIMU
MASPDLDSPWLSPAGESVGVYFNIYIDEQDSADALQVLETPAASVSYNHNIPKPPPLPDKTFMKASQCKRISGCCSVLKETKDMWDRLFMEGYNADVYVITKCQSCIPAHSNVLVS